MSSVGHKAKQDEEHEEKCRLLGSRDRVEKEPVKVKFKSGWRKAVSEWNWRNIALVCVLWLVQVFMTSSYSLIAPFFPSEAAAKGSNYFITGIIISSSPFCLMVCSPIFGYYLPALGGKFTLLSGTLLLGGSCVLMGFLVDMPNGVVFIVFSILLRMIDGIGWSMFTISMFSLLAQFYPKHVGFITGLVEVATGVGFGVGPPIGAVLYTLGGFKLPFISVGGTILLFIPLIMVLMKPTRCLSKALSVRTLLKLLNHGSILVLLFGNMVSFFTMTYINPTFEPFLVKEFGLKKLYIGFIFLIMSAVYMPTAIVIGKLTDIFGTRKFIISGYVTSSIGLFLIGPADFISRPQLWITITALVMIGLGAAGMFVPVYSDLLKKANTFHPNEEKEVMTGLISGMTTFSMSLGEFIGPIAGGAIVQFTDFPTCSVIMGELAIAMGLLMLGVSLIDWSFFQRSSFQPRALCVLQPPTNTYLGNS